MKTQPSPAEIKVAITAAIVKHDKEVMASDCRYNEKLRRHFPAGAVSLIGDAIRQACEEYRLAAIKEAGEAY